MYNNFFAFLFDIVRYRVLVLDKEFKTKIGSLIDECLIPHGIQTHECDKDHWKFRNEDDFKYGHKAGVVMGITLGYYIAKFGKLPDNEDLTEMTHMVELRKDEISTWESNTIIHQKLVFDHLIK